MNKLKASINHLSFAVFDAQGPVQMFPMRTGVWDHRRCRDAWKAWTRHGTNSR